MPPAHRRQLRPTDAERPGLTKQKQDRRHLARRRIAARERQLTAGGGRPPPTGRAPPPPPAPPPAASPRRAAATRTTATCAPTRSSRRRDSLEVSLFCRQSAARCSADMSGGAQPPKVSTPAAAPPSRPPRPLCRSRPAGPQDLHRAHGAAVPCSLCCGDWCAARGQMYRRARTVVSPQKRDNGYTRMQSSKNSKMEV